MDRDHLEGSIERAKSKVREATGKVSSDDDLHAEGMIDQVSSRSPALPEEAQESAKDHLDKL